MFSIQDNDIRWYVRIALVTFAAFASTGTARAQQAASGKFAVFPVPPGMNEGEDQYKVLRRDKDRVIAGTLPFAGNQAKLDQWYNGYFFRSFTQPDQLDKLPLKRQELLADLKRTGKNKAVHDYLIARTTSFMTGFVMSESRLFHPAVRFNAMLILGDLNQEEVSIQRRVPVPQPKMLDLMVREYRNPKQIDAVRVAALLGLIRHAKLDWSLPQGQRLEAAKRNAIGQMMINLLNETEPPGNRSLDGQVWMQRRGIDLLAALGLVGTVDQVNSTLDAIVASDERPLVLRCTAADALSLVDASGQATIDPSQTSLHLASLAASAGRNTLDWIEAYKQEQAVKNAVPGTAYGGGMMGGTMGGMMDTGMMEEEGGMDEMMMQGMMMGANMGEYGGASITVELDPEVKLAQRRLLPKLICVKKGLSGVAGASPVAGKADVADVLQRVDALLDATLTPPEDEPNLEGLARNIRKAVRDIESLTKRSAALGIPSESPVPSDLPSDVPGAVPSAVPGDVPADVPGG